MILPYLFIHMDEKRLNFLCIVVIFGRNYSVCVDIDSNCTWDPSVRLYGLAAALYIHFTNS